MNVRFFDPGREYLSRKAEIDSEMQRVLAAGDLILRKDVEEFEASFAEYVGTKYAIAVASGTDALTLSLAAHSIDEGDVILCPSYTFRATVETAVRTGGRVLLYDLNEVPDFNGVDVWIPAYIAGYVPDEQEDWIREARSRDIVVIEDAAQAIGAAPVVGNTACYSFYPAKILGCYGDGGAIATNDQFKYEWLMAARNHNKGNWMEPGYNSRLDNLQAAVLNVKMRYLQGDIARRKAIAERYDRDLLVKHEPARSVYQDYIVEHRDPLWLKEELSMDGVETMANGYPFPALLRKGPDTLAYEARTLRIPCNPGLTDEEVGHVIESINRHAV